MELKFTYKQLPKILKDTLKKAYENNFYPIKLGVIGTFDDGVLRNINEWMIIINYWVRVGKIDNKIIDKCKRAMLPYILGNNDEK